MVDFPVDSSHIGKILPESVQGKDYRKTMARIPAMMVKTTVFL